MRWISKHNLPSKQQAKQIFWSWQYLLFLSLLLCYVALQPWLYNGPEKSLYETVSLSEAEYALCCNQDVAILKKYLNTKPDPKHTELLLLLTMEMENHRFFKMLADYQPKPLYDERVFYLGVRMCSRAGETCRLMPRYQYLVEKDLLNPVKLFVSRYFFQVGISSLILVIVAGVVAYAHSTKIRYPEKYQRFPTWLRRIGK